jgi:hypothetical protein
VHSKSIINCLDRATKKYFKILKKTLKTVEVEEDNTNIVSEDLPEDMKLTGNGLETEHDKKLAEEEKKKDALKRGNLENKKETHNKQKDKKNKTNIKTPKSNHNGK